MKTSEKTLRGKIFAYIRSKYGTEPEYLMTGYPDRAFFRHSDSQKRFAVVMNIPYEKIDSEKSGMVDILNIRLKDLLMRDMVLQQYGFYSGYKASGRGNWISVVLDGTADLDEICRLIDISYDLTASGSKKREMRPPKEWLIPSNPKYYDIIHAFDDTTITVWKQGAGMKAGDTVFIYVGKPVSAVLYRCRVIETDIPYHFRTDGLTINGLMRIELEKRYAPDCFTFERMKNEFSVFAVRGPRSVPKSLSIALKGDLNEAL